MSSIAKTSISISKKDLAKSRIPPVGVRNVVFYHKATAGDLTIDLLSLTLPSVEMPTVVQASPDEISGARLSVNKKNLSLVSSYKGPLIQGLDYIVVDSSTIRLIGAFESVGAEPEEIFVGTINAGGVSDLVVASSRNVVRSYELPVGQSTLNIANEFKVNMYPSENIGIIKVFVNGVLAFRNTGNSSVVLDRDYYEVDSGNGFGTSIIFNTAPISLPYQIVVDFGVQAITDFDAIGTIESLSGSVKKIADDLAVVAGTDTNDYLMANPSDVERRGFGDMVLNHEVNKADLNGNPAEVFDVANALTSNNAVNLGQFIPSLSSNGYFVFPGGLMIQWCIGVGLSSETTQVVNFPIAFSQVLHVQCSTFDPGSRDGMYQIRSFTNSSVTVFANSFNAGAGTITPYIFAIGIA